MFSVSVQTQDLALAVFGEVTQTVPADRRDALGKEAARIVPQPHGRVARAGRGRLL